MRRLLLTALAPLALGCASTHDRGSLSDYYAQGLFGATDVHRLDVEVESSLGEVVDTELSSFPAFGGAWQVPLREGPLGSELGFEAGFSWAAKWDSSDLVVDTGSLVVAADNDYTLVDVFAGPFLSTQLGSDLRLYGGAGPMLQWGRVELTFDDVPGAPQDVDEEGLGVGLYARAGLELNMGRGTWFGVGARWTDSSIVFDDTIEEVDLQGVQLYASVTFAY